MEKIPVEVFVTEQLRHPRYKSIIAQMAVNESFVQMALVKFFKEQGINFITPGLASVLADRVAHELEHQNGVSGVVGRMLKNK
jgi:hypothetical protein